MTRRFVALLFGALLICSVAIAPDPVAGAALPPRAPAAIDPPVFDVQFGDGVFRVHVRSCEGCDLSLTLEIRVPGVFDAALMPPLPR
jgi:hypothetical protein